MKYFVSILFCLVTLIQIAQKPLYYINMGDAAVANGMWNEAFSYYQEAHSMDTSNFEVAGKLADAAREVKEYDLALSLYTRNYEKDNGKLNPDGLYWLAVMQKYHAQYEDAQRNFKKYIKKHKKSGSADLVKRAEQETKSALWALNYKDNQEFEIAIRLDDPINTSESDIAPLLTSDKFYFSSSRAIENSVDWKIFQMDSLNSKEVSILNIDGLEQSDACANLFVSDQWILFSHKSDGKTQIFSADKSANGFSNPLVLEALNTEGNINTMPFFVQSQLDQRIYFVSDRSGGEGGLDIWYSKIINGEWQTPVNAGKMINSPGDEVSPFVVGDQLYFSSDWHEGLGALDVFSSKIYNGSFDKPVNAGKPINSELNDLYYSESSDGKKVFFASNRRATDSMSSTCCNDIYLVQRKMDDLDSISNTKIGYESLEALQRALPVVLYFHNDEPNPRSLDTTSSVTYYEAYESYIKLVPTYLKENSIGLSGDKKEEAESITSDFFDLQVKKGYEDLRFFSELLLIELEKFN